MKIVYRAENIIDAHLVKHALERAGIVAFVAGEFLSGGIGELPARDLIKVQVADRDFVLADRIAREVELALRTPLADDEPTPGEAADADRGFGGFEPIGGAA